MRRFYVLAGLSIILLLLLPSVSAWSLAPGTWTVYMREDYEITPQTKLALRINNNHNSTISIRFSVYNNTAKTKEGYEPLPNASWIRLETYDVTIPPRTVYEIPVVVDVPNATENYNRSWQFFIMGDQYSGGDVQGTGAVFQYDLEANWKILTPPRFVPENERPGAANFVQQNAPIFLVSALLIISMILVSRFYSKKKVKETEANAQTRESLRNNSDSFN